MASTSAFVVGSLSYKGSKTNFLFFLSALNFCTSAIDIVKSISSLSSNCSTSLFQALNFSGVKTVESLTPRITRLPSSPKISKNLLYSTFAS